MSRAELIYPIRRNIERQLERVSSDPHNKDVLLRYYKVRSTKVAPATLLIEFNRLGIISKMLGKKFEDVSVQDIEDLVYKIDQQKNAPNTKNKYFKVLRIFYRWLRGYPKREFPPEVKWIELKKVPHITVREEDMIPYADAIRISEFAENARDKAWIQCKLDAGCRIGEILTPKIGEVNFNEAGAVVYSDGKTGYQPLILTWSASALAQWLNIHPFKNDKEAPLFCLLNRDKAIQLSYAATVRAFKKCVKKAGFTKRIWLHLLKHVSCTEDAAKGMPDSFRRYKHHWTPNSRMPQVYEHLTKSIIPSIQKETWQRIGGVEKQVREEKPVQLELTRKCLRCTLENTKDSKFCNRCGFALDDNKAAEKVVARAKIDEMLNKISQHPELLKKIAEII